MGDNAMVYIWIALTVVFVIAEAASAQLTTVWFALGALVAFVLAVCGVKSITVQIIVFLAVSAITLIATRPLVKKMMSNIEGKGEVKVKGVVWSARSADDDPIPEGTKVCVKRIEGVKLIVEKTEE